MIFRLSKLTYALLIVSLFLFTDSFIIKSQAADSAEQKEDADSAPDRQLPQLAPGKWQPLFEMGENIFPSVVISTATLKQKQWDDKQQHIGDPSGTIGIALRGTRENCPVKVEISGTGFIGPTVFTGTLPEKDTVYCVYPDLDYDYEKLLSVKQTVPEMLIFKVTIDGKQDSEKAVRVQVRPVNECVFYFADSMGNSHDTSFIFAAYVNENHPFINQVLKEALASKMVDSFEGYSGDEESVKKEIEAVWETLKNKGMHYTTMSAGTEDFDPYLGTQYVRLLGESINYTQSNCVDGSVLMASIFRKIGLNVSLIEIPEHMFIGVSLDREGKDNIYIETTTLASDTLDEAIEDGNKEYMENKEKLESEKEEEPEYNIINIQDARMLGIMPIKDSSAD
ncbi:MAG: hypothetical protein NTY76_07590 [Candidatus Omnitrophica bacterium]|nr:hypothetical protein [Candidatus Omnitrophota bacterium]